VFIQASNKHAKRQSANPLRLNIIRLGLALALKPPKRTLSPIKHTLVASTVRGVQGLFTHQTLVITHRM